METDWSLDYCLACDRQTAGEAYCSQACRLADLETASTGSEPSSPIESRSIAWTPTSRSPVSRLFLAPAIDFAAYRSNTSSSSHPARPFPTHYAPSMASSASSSESIACARVLTPSSSRSSLTSVRSSSAHGELISTQARSELQDYTNSFDQVRDWKRRRAT